MAGGVQWGPQEPGNQGPVNSSASFLAARIRLLPGTFNIWEKFDSGHSLAQEAVCVIFQLLVPTCRPAVGDTVR